MNGNAIHLVSEGILEEIERKKAILEKLPEYYLSNRIKKSRQFTSESLQHSCGLAMELTKTNTKKDRINRSRELNICKENLKNALDWGRQNYKGVLDKDFIKTIGYLIDPMIYAPERYAGKPSFRKCSITIGGNSGYTPSPDKIEREIDIFLEENLRLENLIDRALHSHFHIARVHPFEDGNGRTARLVQNIVLEKGSYYPISIHPFERDEYGELLNKATESYKSNERKFTSEQNKFYNFIALKINTILEEAMKSAYSRKS